MAKILIVEDDPVVSRNVKAWLEKDKHTVDTVADGDEGLYLLQHYSYDLAILDWQLPGKQGAEICAELRAEGKEFPILMLTSKGSLDDKVIGLDSGAYDYLVKPCSLEELSARVRALLRRPTDTEQSNLILGNMCINFDSHEVLVNEKSIQLSPSEYMILVFLCKNVDKAFSAETILLRLWSDKPNVSKQLIRVHITHLRKKLGDVDAELSIVNQKAGGYQAVLPKNSS